MILKLKLLYYTLRVKWFLYLAGRNMRRDNATLKLAIAQLRVIGYNAAAAYGETQNNPQWYSDNAWPNKELQDIFAKKAKKLIQRKFEMTSKFTEREWAWFDLGFGLRSPRKKDDSNDNGTTSSN